MDAEYVSIMCSDIVRDKIKIPHQVFEIIEELRLRRTKDAENEVKLDSLLKDKIELNNQVDDLNMKIKLIEAESLIKIEELQASNISQCALKEEMVRRQKLIIETSEKELKNLRDEICKFQLTKFSLERKTNDQEKKLSLQSSILEAFTKQKSKFESCLKACKDESKDIETTICKLKSEVDDCKKNMKSYHELNSQLSTEVQRLKLELKSLNSQLTFEIAKNARFNLLEETYADHVSSGQVQQEEINFLKETNKRLIEKTESFEKELNDMQDIYTNSQHLLETQTSSYEKCLNRISELEIKLNYYEEQCQRQINDIDKYKSSAETTEIKHQKNIQEVLSKKSELETKLLRLSDENNELRLAMMDLEELNAKWANENLELVDMISQEDTPFQTVTNENDQNEEVVMKDSIEDVEDKVFLMLNKTGNLTKDKVELLDHEIDYYNMTTGDDDEGPKGISAHSTSHDNHTCPTMAITPETSQQIKENQEDVTAIYKKLILSSLASNITSLPNKVSLISGCTSMTTESSNKRSVSSPICESVRSLKYPRLGEPSDELIAAKDNIDDHSFDDVVHFIVNSDNN